MLKYILLILISINVLAIEYETIRCLKDGKERMIRVPKKDVVKPPINKKTLQRAGVVLTGVGSLNNVVIQPVTIHYTQVLIAFKGTKPNISEFEEIYKLKYVRTLVNGYLLFQNRSGASDAELIGDIISHENNILSIKPDRIIGFKAR